MAKNPSPKTKPKSPDSAASGQDQKALAILLKYAKNWGSQWVSMGPAPAPSAPSAEDIAYATRAGYMFAPVTLSHAQLIGWLKESFSQVKKKDVVAAFLASLSTKRLEWRSALGSFAVARMFPEHAFLTANPTADSIASYCAICGFHERPTGNPPIDLNLSNVSRLTSGGASWNQTQPEYPAFDLELFAKMPKPMPGPADFDIMRRMINVIRNMPPTSRLVDLQKELGAHLASNKTQRQALIEILGFCSILETPDHPGFLNTFIPYKDRGYAAIRGDWAYPAEFWRGRHGINEEALRFWFGHVQELFTD